MRFHNGLRRVVASLFAFATLPLATFGQVAALQTAKSLSEEAPSPAAAMAAYRATDGWVRSWQAPTTVPPGLAALPGGAHVQLRLDGLLIGRGQAFPAPGATAGTALLQAAREAMQAAEARLQLPNDAMREAALREQAARIMISVDVAGPLIAFDPATWSEAELSLSPGLEGVAAAVQGGADSTGMLASAFPSMLIATNTLPHRALGGLCAQMIGEGGAAAAMEPPVRIRERHGLRMYRFRTTHLAQCKPGAEPVFLYRGARLIDQSEITAEALLAMAQDMARHLSEVPAEAYGRTYSPGSDTWSGGGGEVESVALELLALRAYLNLPAPQGFLPGRANVRAAMAQRVSWISTAPPSAVSDPNAAMLLLTLLASPAREPGPAVPTGSAALPSAAEPVRWLAERSWVGGSMMGGLDPVIKGLCALAYATFPRSRTLGPDNEVNERPLVVHDSAIREWIGAVPAGNLVGNMPWLGWAEIELAKRHENAGGAADIPSAVALREMRRQVWEHQVGAIDIDKDSLDLAGGIVFTKGTSPLPTWQCTRPLAFIGTMLADIRLTEPKERAGELARLLRSLRFIRQLQADESIGWMAKDLGQAIGGVRAAPWDSSMPPDATSMALLAVAEAIRSLEALSLPAIPGGAARQDVELPANP